MHLEMVTRVKSQERPSAIRRGTKNLAEELRVGPEHVRGFTNLCRKIRRKMVDDKLQSLHSTGPKATFFHFAQDKCIYKLLSKHSECGIKFDEVVCIGNQLVDCVVYVGVSTCSIAECCAMSFERLRVDGTLRTWAMKLSIYAITKSTPSLPT